jgi:hypothetical protein
MEVLLSSKGFAAAKMLTVALCNIKLPGSLRHSRSIFIIIIVVDDDVVVVSCHSLLRKFVNFVSFLTTLAELGKSDH